MNDTLQEVAATRLADPGTRQFPNPDPPSCDRETHAEAADPSPGSVSAWVAPLWDDLLPRLREPVRVTETRTTRQVEFLRQHVFVVDSRRRRVFLFERQGERLHPLHANIDLLRPITRWVWLEVFVARAGVPLELRERVTAALKGRVRQVTTQRRLAASIRAALALEDHPALALALRARPCKHRHGLIGRDFNLVWQNLARFRQVARDTPGLLPLVMLAHLGGAIDGETDAVAQLKAALLARGITQAGWRLLAREGYDLVEQAIAYFTRESALTVAARYARTFAQAGATHRPPRAFVAAWLAIFPEDSRVGRDWTAVPAHVLRAALRELGRCTTPAAVRAFLPGFLAVDHWVVHAAPSFDANQKRLGWPSLLARAHTWQQLRAIEIECDGIEWDGLGGPWEIGDLRVEVIRTAKDLFLEGFHLRHCIFDRLEHCRTHQTAVYGVRGVRGGPAGKRLATLEFLCLGDDWLLNDARVFGNRPAPAPIRRIAGRILPDIRAAGSAREPLGVVEDPDDLFHRSALLPSRLGPTRGGRQSHPTP